MLRCAWQMVDNNPKNQHVITPCFRRQLDINDPLGSLDAKQLTDDLAAALNTWCTATDPQLTVSAYNLQGTKPNYPLAQTKTNIGSFPTPGAPGELALCLSFYADQNQPRRRGRLYVPVWAAGAAGSDMQSVASAGLMTKVGALAPIFANLGGANVDWGVWSRVDNAFHKATNYWVDNAWDVQRSRGFPPTARNNLTTSG
jgi:hypothetical protein